MRFCQQEFGEFPRLVGRYCSYLLPKQAGGTPQILVDKTSRMTGRLRVYFDSSVGSFPSLMVGSLLRNELLNYTIFALLYLVPELDVVVKHRVGRAGVIAEAALRRPLSRVVHHVEPVLAPH